MPGNCKKLCAKIFLAVLLSMVAGSFTVPGLAQEKIRLSYSAVSPSTAFLWIPKEKGFFKSTA
jgi:ABC-type nitrate/sulfonate/bicarbonate transport system substrate-binding protein